MISKCVRCKVIRTGLVFTVFSFTSVLCDFNFIQIKSLSKLCHLPIPIGVWLWFIFIFINTISTYFSYQKTYITLKQNFSSSCLVHLSANNSIWLFKTSTAIASYLIRVKICNLLRVATVASTFPSIIIPVFLKYEKYNGD